MKKVVRGFLLFSMILLVQLSLLPHNEAYGDEETILLTELNIKVMPEFINPDEWDYTIPSLLIGYHGTIINQSDTAYNEEIKIKIPTHLPLFQAGFLAQFKDPLDTNPIEELYTVDEVEQVISWTPTNPIEPNGEYLFVLEYFSGSIDGVVDRSFTFEYIPENDIDYVNIAFYSPYRAENFQIDKEANERTQNFGVEIQLFEFVDLKQGDILDFTVSYHKESIVTTVEAFNDFNMPDDAAHAGLNEQVTVPENSSNANVETIVMVILTLIIVVVFIFIIVQKKKANTVVSKDVTDAPKKIVNKDDEIKKLRKMLADGQIDEKTYKERRSKLG